MVYYYPITKYHAKQMQRVQEAYIEKIERIVPFAGRTVLEIGCGDGSRSVTIAERCKTLRAMDPDKKSIQTARRRNLSNARFDIGSAYSLPFKDNVFDSVIYTLSFHHVPAEQMSVAIDGAIRVVREDGSIIFLEPTLNGTLFEAEIYFDAWDGDERTQKRIAREAILHHDRLVVIHEEEDEAITQFESVEDFIISTNPKQHREEIRAFLEAHHYRLNANHRITICRPKSQGSTQ